MGKGTTSADKDGCAGLMTLRRKAGSGWEELEMCGGGWEEVSPPQYLRVCGGMFEGSM